MTEIEKQALALLNECGWGGAHLKRAWNPRYEALCRAIEQHEAFRQEVSDEIAKLGCWPDTVNLQRFILPKPVDPLVEAWDEAWGELNDKAAKLETFRAALAKRRLEVREIEG